jgi:hypothetical protein
VRSATGLWLRAHWRSRRLAILGLIVLAGLAGAVVIASAAGARRTATSLERLRDEARSADILVSLRGQDALAAQVADLPMVTASRAINIMFAGVEGVEGDMGLLLTADGNDNVAVERDRLLRGRRFDPSMPLEVEINESAARDVGVDVGDVVTVETLTPEQVAAEEYFPFQGPSLDLKVVGVTRGIGDLDAGNDGSFVGGSRLMEQIADEIDVFATYVAIRLQPGVSASEFEDAVHELAPPDAEVGFLSDAVRTKATRDAVSVLALGLTVFALVAGVATVVIVAQAVGRHVGTGAREQEILVALGSTRTTCRTALVLATVPIALGAALVGVVAALLASPVFPIGLARRAEPDPGLDSDALAFGLGALGIMALVLGAATVSAWWHVRVARTRQSDRPASTIAASVAHRVGIGPVSASGIRLALDRSAPAPPVRSSIVGVVVAVAGTVAVLTFAASLDDLVDSPTRWGQPWDVMMNFTSDTIDDATREITADERFVSVARWDSGFSFVNDQGFRAYGIDPVRGDGGFSLRSGRQPTSPDDIVLGREAAERLGVEVGDTVEVVAGEDGEPASAQVVGIALFPEIDEGNFTEAVGYFGGAFEQHAVVPDAFEASQLVVRVRDGEDLAAVQSSVEERYPDSFSAESFPTPPRTIGNVNGLRGLPRWLAAFVMALGVASIVHILATTMRRRRHELATLRGLGFTRAQVARCLVAQAVAVGVVGLVVGVPLGFIAGRATWTAVSDSIGVTPGVVSPWLGIGLVCAGALVVAALVGVPFGRWAARLTPAAALRTE